MNKCNNLKKTDEKGIEGDFNWVFVFLCSVLWTWNFVFLLFCSKSDSQAESHSEWNAVIDIRATD